MAAQFQRFLSDFYQPNCLVLSTTKVKEMCRENQLSPAELLRPFGDFSGTRPFSQLKKFNWVLNQKQGILIEIKGMRLNFTDSHYFKTLEPHIARKQFEHAMKYSRADYLSSKAIQLQRGQIQDYFAQDPTPWFSEWCASFQEFAKFMDHECIEQPVAAFYLISTDEPDIELAAQNLQAPAMLPQSFHQNVLTIERVPKVFLLLHEPRKGQAGKDEINRLIKKLESKYQAYAQILTINSEKRVIQNEKQQKNLPDIWTPYITKRSDSEIDSSMLLVVEGTTSSLLEIGDPRPVRSEEVGGFLAIKDRQILRVTIQRVFEDVILQEASRKIRQLEEKMSHSQKSFAMSFSSFWKKSDRPQNSGQSPHYKMTDKQRTMRMLADLAFLFHAYDLAANIYKKATNEFRSIKAMKQAGSCQQFQALAQIAASGGMRRDTQQLLEGAYSYFAKTFGKNKFLTLIRNVLISTSILKIFGKYKEAARLFAKASGVVSESPLVGPLFLEQTAACFLRINSPKPFFRKFCFYEYLAGNLYKKIELYQHAFHCYTMIKPYYCNNSLRSPIMSDESSMALMRESVISNMSSVGLSGVTQDMANIHWVNIAQQVFINLGYQAIRVSNPSLATQHFKSLIKLVCEYPQLSSMGDTFKLFLKVVHFARTGSLQGIDQITSPRKPASETTSPTNKDVKLIDFGVNESNPIPVSRSATLIDIDPFSESVVNQEFTQIGFLPLPKIYDNTIDIFINDDRVSSNFVESLHGGRFEILQEFSSKLPPWKSGSSYSKHLNSQKTPWRVLSNMMQADIILKAEQNEELAPAKQLDRHQKIDLDVYDTRSRNWKRKIMKDKKRSCRVNQQITVSLKIKNPINVDIYIDKIHLICNFYRAQEPEKNQAQEVPTDFKAHSLSLTLTAFEERTLLLEVTPLAIGELHIQGVEWVLYKEVCCTYMFQIERLFPQNYFIIQSLPSAPILKSSFILSGRDNAATNRPFISGELTVLLIRVKNSASNPHPITHIHFISNYPLIFGFVARELPLDEPLQPGQEKIIELPARAAFNGNIEVKLLLRYLTQNSEGKMIGRYQRMKLWMRVQRSISIMIETGPSLKNANETILKYQAYPASVPSNTPADLVPQNYIKNIDIQQISIKSEKMSIAEHFDRGIMKNAGKSITKFFSLVAKEEVQEEDQFIVYQTQEVADGGSLLDIPVNSNFVSMKKGDISSMVDLEKAYYVEHFVKGVKLHENLFDIVTFWEIELSRGMKVKGFLHNPANIISNARGGVHSDCPLHVAFAGQKELIHDFSESKICRASVILKVINQHVDKPLTFKIQANNRNPQRGSPVQWIKKSEIKVRDLGPEEEKHLEFVAAIGSQGIYDLNRFKFILIEYRREKEVEVSHFSLDDVRFLVEVKNKQITQVKQPEFDLLDAAAGGSTGLIETGASSGLLEVAEAGASADLLEIAGGVKSGEGLDLLDI